MSLTQFELKLTGNDPQDLIKLNEHFLIHKDALTPFQKLQELAHKNGFDLRPVSTYRNFERQMSIWNQKASGKRPLLKDDGTELKFDELSPKEIVFSIMRWSALPGFSRHHWGSDLDVYDHKKIPTPDYQLELTPQEVKLYFSNFHQWLDQLIQRDQSFGFYRPYSKDLGGVAPEKWHLSFHPTANQFESYLNLDFFSKTLESELFENLLLKEVVFENKEVLFDRFIKKTNL